MPSIVDDPNENFNERPIRPNGIIVHSAAETLDKVPAENFMRQNRYSYHNLIRPNGEIIRAVDWDKRAWHAGKSRYEGQTNLNDSFIGICLLVQGADNWTEFLDRIADFDAYTDEQYESLAYLCKKATKKYDFDTIVPHSLVSGPDVRDDPKPDPGTGFSFPRLKQKMEDLNGDS